MGKNIFLVSDTHWCHSNICKFTNRDGSKVRPWDDVEEMNEVMVDRWNSVVRTSDIVYHLGDVAFNRNASKYLERLNGEKKLILGNHDNFEFSFYANYFNGFYSSKKLDKFFLTHIPVHEGSIPQWANANIHGHIHGEVIDDVRYINVSVEQINYTPISLEEIKEMRR